MTRHELPRLPTKDLAKTRTKFDYGLVGNLAVFRIVHPDLSSVSRAMFFGDDVYFPDGFYDEPLVDLGENPKEKGTYIYAIESKQDIEFCFRIKTSEVYISMKPKQNFQFLMTAIRKDKVDIP